MRVFVPSKNRAKTLRTHKVFPDATVVVHTATEATAYRAANPGLNVVVSGVVGDAYGLTRQREWICKNLAKPGEWFVFADDNIRSIVALVDPYYDQETLPINIGQYIRLQSADYRTIWRRRLNTLCPTERFLQVIASDTIAYCKKIGAHLAGFSLTDNILVRNKKFSACGYAIGKLMLWHNTGRVPFDHTISMEDFYHTAINLLQYGVSVVNHYVYPRSGHYQPGGMGTYEERVPVRQRDVRLLMARFPGLFRVKDREGFAPNTDLQLLVNEKTVEAWRKRMNSRLI
jgi:hypothetical protein